MFEHVRRQTNGDPLAYCFSFGSATFDDALALVFIGALKKASVSSGASSGSTQLVPVVLFPLIGFLMEIMRRAAPRRAESRL